MQQGEQQDGRVFCIEDAVINSKVFSYKSVLGVMWIH
jgi:hypothetical protein